MKNDYYITDDEIANRLGIERRAVAQMITKYSNKLEQFGEIGIAMSNSDSGQARKYRLLNKQHYCLLVLYSKNTEKSVNLKYELVKEMYGIK